MTRSAKRYNTAYKKRVDVERDVYLPRGAPEGIVYCSDCGAVYYRRRWTLAPPQEICNRGEFRSDVRSTFCPACRKIRDHYPFGEVLLLGITPEEKNEVLHLLRNEEKRAREKNPLERIMSIQAERAGWKVETTTEKLAQRLGRCLQKARRGNVAYKWSHNNKFVRVTWERGTLRKP